MLTQTERFFYGQDFRCLRAAYITRAKIEAARTAESRSWMLDNGFELLDIPADQLLTDDGREVLLARGFSEAEIAALEADGVIVGARRKA